MEKEEDLLIEPEECEECIDQFEESGMEYTFDYYVEEGYPYCEHCRRPL